MGGRVILWFRNDLRLLDNTIVHTATKLIQSGQAREVRSYHPESYICNSAPSAGVHARLTAGVLGRSCRFTASIRATTSRPTMATTKLDLEGQSSFRSRYGRFTGQCITPILLADESKSVAFLKFQSGFRVCHLLR